MQSTSTVVTTTTVSDRAALVVYAVPLVDAKYIALSSHVTASVYPEQVENTVRIDTSTGIRGTSSREVDYNMGILDFFTETIVLGNPIVTRNFGFFSLEDPINVITSRDGSTIEVLNKAVERDAFYEAYNLGNAGHTITSYENNAFMDTGVFAISGSIGDLEYAYPDVSILDFEQRKFSAITLTGVYFNLAAPSINEVGSILSSNISDVDTSLSIQNASGFPNSGRIILDKEVIEYTSKSGNTLLGLVRGADNTIATSHTINSYLRSF